MSQVRDQVVNLCDWRGILYYSSVICSQEKRTDRRSAQDTPRSSSQHKGDLVAPEGQRQGIRNSRQEIEEEEEGKGMGEGIFVLGDKD